MSLGRDRGQGLFPSSVFWCTALASSLGKRTVDIISLPRDDVSSRSASLSSESLWTDKWYPIPPLWQGRQEPHGLGQGGRSVTRSCGHCREAQGGKNGLGGLQSGHMVSTATQAAFSTCQASLCTGGPCVWWARGGPHHVGTQQVSTDAGKESACSAGDLGSIPGSGRSPGEENGNPLQYSYLKNSTVRGPRQATVHGPARVRHDLLTKPAPDAECPAHLPEGQKLLVPIPTLPISGCGTSCESLNFFFFFIEINLT